MMTANGVNMQVTLSPSPVSETGGFFDRLEPVAIENTLVDMDETIRNLEDLVYALRAEPIRTRASSVTFQSHSSSPMPTASQPTYTHQTFEHGYFGPLAAPNNSKSKTSKIKSKSKSMREHAKSLPIPSLSAHGINLKLSSSDTHSTDKEKEKEKKKRGRGHRVNEDGLVSRSQSKHKRVMEMFGKRPSLSRASQSDFNTYHSQSKVPHKVSSTPSLAAAVQEPENPQFAYLSEAILQLRRQHEQLLQLIPAPVSALRKTSQDSSSPSRDLPPTPSDSDDSIERFDAELEAITASALEQAAASEGINPIRPPLALVSSKGHLSRASIASTNVSVSIWHDAESRPSSPVPDVAAALAAVVERERETATSEEDDDTVVHSTPPESSKASGSRGVPAVDPGSVVRRTKLEVPAPPAPGLKSALKVISSASSSGSMPLLFNEPFSVLQRMAEEMEYTALLSTANRSTDPIARLCYVAAFAISSYAGSAHRNTRKPCNPLLGETFEFDRPDLGFRFVAEKVSHLPMQTASHAEGPGWVSRGLMQVKQGRKKASYEISPLGWQYVELSEWKETYKWGKPPTYLSLNPFGSGPPCIAGKMCIVNETRGESIEVEFRDVGRCVDGVIRDSDGEGKAWLRGSWDKEIFVRFGSSTAPEKQIWKATPFSPNPERNFGLSPFALTLNELTPDLYTADGKLLVAPTDSRLRPDQRMYEQGKVDDAEALKHTLETRQRRRNSENKPVKPRWFRRESGTGEAGTDEWRYQGGYWETRQRESWQDGARELW